MSILAVDLGGTRIKVGHVTDGRVTSSVVIAGHGERGFAQVLPRLGRVLGEMRTGGGGGDGEVTGIGMALPTLVDTRAGAVLCDMRGKYEGLRETDLAGWAKREFSLPLRIENDAHAAMLGEWRRGAGARCEDLVLITLGTGIGSSVILGGRALRGRHAQAGNLGGHMVVNPGGRACGCGAQGCVEAEQNRAALTGLARSDPRYRSSPLAALPEVDYESLFALAEHDDLSRELRDRSLGLWSAMVTGLVHQFDCERVIVGGGVMRSAEAILPALRAATARACTPWGRAQVMAAELGDEAALVGMGELFERPPEFI